MLFVPLLGGLTGLAGHALLVRLRRGAVVRKGWCVVGVALLWTVPVVVGVPLWWLPVPLVVAWFAVLLTVVDLKHRRLPNVLTYCAYPAAAVAIGVAATQLGWWVVAGAVVGAVGLVSLYLFIHVLSPRAMGAGDVKLSGSQGAVLGAVGLPAVLIGAMAAALLTLLLSWVTPRRLRFDWQSGIPHGPALLAATYVLSTFSAAV